MGLSVAVAIAERQTRAFKEQVIDPNNQALTNTLLSGRIAWLTALKLAVNMNAFTGVDDAKSMWTQLLNYTDTGIIDFVIAGAGEMYLLYGETINTMYAQDAIVDYEGIWERLITAVATSLTFCHQDGVNAATDPDFQKRGCTAETYADLFRKNPWLLYIFLLRAVPIPLEPEVKHRAAAPSR